MPVCGRPGLEGVRESARSFPRLVGALSLAATIGLAAFLAAGYVVSGDKEFLLALLLILAMAPLDVLLVKSIISSRYDQLADYVVELLEGLDAESVASMMHWGRLFVAARTRIGDVHVFASTNSLLVAVAEAPMYLPAETRRPPLLLREALGSAGRGCRVSEGSLESFVGLDPVKGCLAHVRGRVRYLSVRCAGGLDYRRVREHVQGFLSRTPNP